MPCLCRYSNSEPSSPVSMESALTEGARAAYINIWLPGYYGLVQARDTGALLMGCYRGTVSGNPLDSNKFVRVRQVDCRCSICGVHVPPCYCVNRSSVQSSSVLHLSISEPTALIAKYYFHTSSLLISAEPSHRYGSWQNLAAGLSVEAQWLLHIPPRLTFNNSTLCPEQTASISLYNLNLLVFITETECVYCAVRTGFPHMKHVILSLKSDLPTSNRGGLGSIPGNSV